MWVQSLGQEDSLEEVMATHSSILAWRIPWTEEPGRLWFTGLQRVGHDWSDLSPMYMCLLSSLLKICSRIKKISTYAHLGVIKPFCYSRNRICLAQCLSPVLSMMLEYRCWIKTKEYMNITCDSDLPGSQGKEGNILSHIIPTYWEEERPTSHLQWMLTLS